VAFQAFFSLRPLGWEDGEEKQRPAYLHYTLGADGLIAGEAPVFPEEAAGMGDVPPFPLAELMKALDFEKYSPAGGASVPEEMAPVLIALLLSLPVFVRTRRGDKKGKNRLVYKEFVVRRGFALRSKKKKGIAAEIL
ncbi:MAG: hypothetical protein LBL28_07855, partial [Treponema sp.]|nr:hypothetical protein [Treponema sp.]